MKYILSLIFFAQVTIFGCNPENRESPKPDYTCKGIQAAMKDLNNLYDAIDSKEKAKALDFYKKIETYFKNWPTSGPRLSCPSEDGDEIYTFDQGKRDSWINTVDEAKAEIDALK